MNLRHLLIGNSVVGGLFTFVLAIVGSGYSRRICRVSSVRSRGYSVRRCTDAGVVGRTKVPVLAGYRQVNTRTDWHRLTTSDLPTMSDTERVDTSVEATRRRGWYSSGGRFTVTTSRIIFTPHRTDRYFGQRDWMCSVGDVEDVTVDLRRSTIDVQMRSGQHERFLIDDDVTQLRRRIIRVRDRSGRSARQ